MKRSEVRLLIGEDDAGVALDMQKELTELGYRVEREAGSPKEVVLSARELKPDVIVLDMNIDGDTHGIEVAREIHDIARIPIVFVASIADDVLANDHVLPRPYRYVTKPYVLQELDKAIEELWTNYCSRTRSASAYESPGLDARFG